MASNYDLTNMGDEHLWYEICMLFDTARNIASGQYANNNVILSALLESFATHSRNLLDFFYGKPQQDDAHISQFVNDAKHWGRFSDSLNQTELERLRKRANKEVAHLTFARLNVDASEKPWNRDIPIVLENLIRPALIEFSRSANYQLLGPRMTELLGHFKKQ